VAIAEWSMTLKVEEHITNQQRALDKGVANIYDQDATLVHISKSTDRPTKRC